MSGPRALVNPASTWDLPNLVPLYEAVRERLKGHSELDGIHGAAGRVFIEGDQPAGTPSGLVQWGNTIVVPWSDLGDREYHPTQPFAVGVLVREEQGASERQGFNPRYPLALAHRWHYRLLDGWAPVVAGLQVGPFWLASAPNGEALFDEQDRMWYASALWRTDIIVP